MNDFVINGISEIELDSVLNTVGIVEKDIGMMF